MGSHVRRSEMSEETEVRDVDVQTDDEADDLLVEEVSIDGMCGVY